MALSEPSRTLRTACERFVETGAAPQGVRPEIAASWRRSRLSGVSRSADLHGIPHRDVNLEGRVLGAARPVLDRLTEVLAGTSTSIILTDASAHILDRWVDDRSLHRSLDRVAAAPGADFGEAVIGTNGLGTAVESRRAVQISGPEHFHEALTGFTCVGAPINHPVTNRLEGVLDLSCRFEGTNPLILPMVLEGVRAIQERLLEASSVTERALLAHFLRAKSRSSHPVLSLNATTVITNAAADNLLHTCDHHLLWERISPQLASGRQTSDAMALTDGRRVRVRWRPVEVGARVVGAVIELEAEVAAPPPAVAATATATATAAATAKEATPRLSGTGAAHRRLVAEVARHGGSELALLVTGEPGAGKLAVARTVHDGSGRGTCTVLDAASSFIDGSAAWLRTVRDELARPGTLVLRHLQVLDEAGATALASLVDGGDSAPPARVVGTMTVTAPARVAHLRPLIDRFPLQIDVPPLRTRPEDLEPLVTTMLKRHARDGSSRCRPDVVAVLARCDWPGNVRQLENVVRALVARRPTGDIVVDDLPPELKRARPGLSGLQQMEHDAIVAALEATDGNRLEAAAALGISRSTLYRKLHAYGLEPTV